MSDHPADVFISTLKTTVQDFQAQAKQSKELIPLIDMSGHMIEALGALRLTQLRAGDSIPAPSHS